MFIDKVQTNRIQKNISKTSLLEITLDFSGVEKRPPDTVDRYTGDQQNYLLKCKILEAIGALTYYWNPNQTKTASKFTKGPVP